MDQNTNGATTSPLQEYLQTVENLNSSSFGNEEDRLRALHATYALVSRIESPWETIVRLGMGQPALCASLKVVKDLGLFKKWHARGDQPLSSKELAEMISECEEALLQRIVRHLAANNVLEETAVGVFQPTSLSIALLEPVFDAWIDYIYDAMIPCYYQMPTYLEKTGYKNPIDPEDGVFQYTKGWKGNLFAYYDAHEREGKSFNNMMGAVMANQASWLDIYPHQTLLDADGDHTTPLLVDVGGSVGHDIERFRQAHPEVAARLVLQDRAEVVKLSKCPDPVKKMAYDFFTPQPVRGARVYYMHGVIHDWSDGPARKILEAQRGAMDPGYSRLLIHDHVVAEQRAHPHATAYDLTMMVKVAGQERSEDMWRYLLASAGLRVVKIWKSPLAAQSVIEAEVAENAA